MKVREAMQTKQIKVNGRDYRLDVLPNHKIAELIDGSDLGRETKDSVEAYIIERREKLIDLFGDLCLNEGFRQYQAACISYLESDAGKETRSFICKALGN
jgi:predicted nucleotide-binding protein (sugar kinase/HSP70/actin superfamily)